MPGGFAALALVTAPLCLLLLLVPVPAALLDVLLLGNLGVATALFLWAARAGHPRRMPLFPALLVLLMMLRLGLSIAALRLILLSGQAGVIIDGAARFFLGDDLIAGIALLLCLAVVQYLVLARGSERLAEVVARFFLDALPGQQAAIEADLRSGALTPQQAQARRAALLHEANLHGAMDGALRLVKGDVVAGLLVLAIGLLAGLVGGAASLGLSLSESLSRSALPICGLGLLTQLPALLVAVAAGLLLTRGVAAPPGTEGLERQAAPPALLSPEDLGLEDVQRLLERLQGDHPALVRETVPRRVELATLWAVLRLLLAEGVAPLDLRLVLEAIALQQRPEQDPVLLCEQVRARLGSGLAQGYLRDPRNPDPTVLHAVILDPEIEETIREAVSGPPGAEVLAIEPELSAEIAQAAAQAQARLPYAVLLCHKDVRRHVRALLQVNDRLLPVLAFSELVPAQKVVTAGRIGVGGLLLSGP